MEIIINNLTPRRIARSLRAQVGGIVNVGLLGGFVRCKPSRERSHSLDAYIRAPRFAYRRGTRG